MLIPADPVHAFVDYPDVPVPNASKGPLAGLTFAVKDVFDVAGYPTGCGNPAKRAESGLKKAHAPAVAALLEAGARFVGKTHTAELAFSLDGRNSRDGTPINPAAPGRVPGGSSSGSASAVAAKLVDFALGSDTGGSVRGPASFCGVIGLRPTFGRINTAGVLPLAPSFDTVGWFTRDIDLYDRVGAELLGEDAAGAQLGRMIVVADAFDLLAGPEEAAALKPAVARVGAHLKPGGKVIAAPEGRVVWQQTYRIMQGYEAWQAHGAWVSRHWADLTAAVRGRFEVSSKVTEAEYRDALRKRAEVHARLVDLIGADGVMVQPTMPSIAPLMAASDAELESFRARALSMLSMAGLTGFPQISLPLAVVDGCPLGLSLIAPPGRDRALIELARRILA